ncbi:MAG: 2-C-methyl-D-erythritol 2,4-cyclodiphosphate synthase [Tenericutes bacterium HGW-Tenericutes-2]|jgi:2-C-methyl-D-erythritol 4-phosphate cytidylyltransferase/2-C-methyl-D-erythritol 4-phosphate cytidylyltransferase/2-C-methyl-D-erythritol 2,4-cyclodiphosphate synthase|nr:MAG: 2-C-methyl-D-erythritol 2,4-cyclodiphosphate synthase [Tenericutes bacterium HGW-Tenericutes-2]
MNTALIVAAGTGSRAQLNQSKILYKVNGKPLFLYSVELFLSLGHQIILVVSKEDINEIRKYVTDEIKLVLGGKTRGESVMNGLREVQTPYVFIHDAARPLITKQAVMEIEKVLQFQDAVLLAEKLTSALKKYNDKDLTSMNRDDFILAQTPQAFLTEKIRYAYIRNDKDYVDDVSLYQAFYPEDKVKVVINTEPNTKATYPQDFSYIQMILKERDENLRIGHSFDIHQLVENRPLILGGIQIPFEKGLLGHSDADVLLHAIAEAMLGALALGDLGSFYPDTDPAYKDIDSKRILKETYDLIRQKGYEIGNIDATVYAELPKLNPHIKNIKENISKLLTIRDDQISVKATTYEKMDAIGEQKAIASEAVVLLKKV